MRGIEVLPLLLLIAAIATFPRPASAACVRDRECGGDQICDEGECIAPPEAPAAAEPYWYASGYGTASGVLSLHGWGDAEDQESGYNWDGGPSPSTSDGFGGGVHVAGYAVFTDFAHIGGYASFFRNTESFEWASSPSDGFAHDVSLVGFGVSMKFGGHVGQRVFLSGAFDFGTNIAVSDLRGSTYGVQFFPRVSTDVLLLENFGMTVAIGPLIVPYAVGMLPQGDSPGDDLVDARCWALYLQALVGFSFGG
ncbi:MAG: hypothetical protein HY907_19060 [Deltaproteobacteria bacterium]|nr:hypothetical protein [Deltaproteobacteria bacterium]